MSEKSLGQELIDAVNSALKEKGTGKIVRPQVDIVALRKKLGLTQKEFSQRYHINLSTLRKWEQEERTPDSTTRAYLTCIEKRPKLIEEILSHV